MTEKKDKHKEVRKIAIELAKEMWAENVVEYSYASANFEIAIILQKK